MRTRELEREFNTIVATLLSTQKVDPEIIRNHVKQYAKDAGVTYDLARQAVILKAKDHLIKQAQKI